MPGFLLALVLIVVTLAAYWYVIRAVVFGDGLAYVATRRAWIYRTVRRETADLDRRYEQLLRG